MSLGISAALGPMHTSKCKVGKVCVGYVLSMNKWSATCSIANRIWARVMVRRSAYRLVYVLGSEHAQ